MSLNRTYRQVDGVTIPGTFLQAFIKNGQHYFVAEIKIYRDGIIDTHGFEHVDLEGFKLRVRTGWVRTTLPEGARVSMMLSSLNFDVSNVKAQVEEEEFIKEVEDEIRRLNAQPTSAQLCAEALENYKKNPTEFEKDKLRQAYETVPKHRRKFLGDMDSKDWEYKRILGMT